ncbi:gluconokinase [Nocardia sp. NPDC024068]|uniref:gluconokinase n=1 Tax=Nocardia sp. NPDC024068 TaxID=3157197 RepID=UPI0033E2FD9D
MTGAQYPTALPGSPYVVVMGVSGTGKSTTGRLLALRLDVPFADADDFHPPANLAKMSAGVPLDDEDRRPWLAAVGEWLRHRRREGSGGVIACSALKREYRDRLRTAVPGIFFVHLAADRADLLGRISARGTHFMPATLLDSQLDTLEPLHPDEPGVTVRGTSGPDHAVDLVAERIPGHTGTL